MPKVNPWSLARKAPAPQTKSFTDPDHPGAEFSFTCRKLDACELMLANEKAAELVARWITGENGQGPLEYPLGRVRFSESLLLRVVLAEMMQQDEQGSPYAGADAYNADDLIGLAHNAGTAFAGLCEWVQQVQGGGVPEGNAPGADAGS
jgi:hypothetical protein